MTTATPTTQARTIQPCANCGREIFYSVSVSPGSHWLHADTYYVTCNRKRPTND